MQKLKMHDPLNPQAEHQILQLFKSPQGKNDYYFIKQNNYLLVYNERYHTFPSTARSGRAGTTELLNYQFEMPLPGIRWFIDVIEQKFFKSPDEGGLPAHKLSYEEIVAGEDLHVMRSMGGGDRPGYTLTNATRRSHGAERNPQRLNLSDHWLFQDGLMDYFKELADKYEQGKL